MTSHFAEHSGRIMNGSGRSLCFDADRLFVNDVIRGQPATNTQQVVTKSIQEGVGRSVSFMGRVQSYVNT